MHKGHTCLDANVHIVFILLYLSMLINNTVFLTDNECIQQSLSSRCSGVMQENHPVVLLSPVY